MAASDLDHLRIRPARPQSLLSLLASGELLAAPRFGTNHVLSHAWHRLQISPHIAPVVYYPRLTPTVYFPALGTVCILIRAWQRLHVFDRLATLRDQCFPTHLAPVARFPALSTGCLFFRALGISCMHSHAFSRVFDVIYVILS